MRARVRACVGARARAVIARACVRAAKGVLVGRRGRGFLGAKASQPASTPYPVCDGVVDEDLHVRAHPSLRSGAPPRP